MTALSYVGIGNFIILDGEKVTADIKKCGKGSKYVSLKKDLYNFLCFDSLLEPSELIKAYSNTTNPSKSI